MRRKRNRPTGIESLDAFISLTGVGRPSAEDWLAGRDAIVALKTHADDLAAALQHYAEHEDDGAAAERALERWREFAGG